MAVTQAWPVPDAELERTASLSERVYARLQSDVLAGRLRPGERLLDTRIAAQLGVSRTPVRDALRQLVRDQLVRTSAGGRYHVAEPDRAVFLEFVACRELLEPGAAAAAAAMATSADRAALAAALQQSSGALRGADVAAAAHDTLDFHAALAAAAHNGLLAELLRFIRVPVAPLRGLIFANGDSAAATDREHHAIYAAVAAGDATAAAEAALRHARGDRDRGLLVLDRMFISPPPTGRPGRAEARLGGKPDRQSLSQWDISTASQVGSATSPAALQLTAIAPGENPWPK
ncbi:MAG: GntR family transcriptional regulator [Chloroflexi bacterium]|nr:GntR family transcriptional regulator [Chloroflexota bacterium]